MTEAANFPTLESLLDCLPGAAFRASRNYPNFSIQYISDGCRETFGRTPDEMAHNDDLGMPDLIHPDDLPEFCEKISSTIMLPHPSEEPFEHTARVLRPDGSVRWVWVKCRLASYCDDEPDNSIVTGVFLDVTDRMTIKNDELTRLARQDFVVKISRDIRTPVSSIKGLSGLLLETPLDILQQNYVENVIESADNLLGVLSEITGISLIESPDIPLQKHDFSPRELMDELSDIFAFKAERKGLSLNLAVERTVPEFVSGDSICLKEILQNLIETAIKYTLDGTLTVSCGVDANMPVGEAGTALMFKVYADDPASLNVNDLNSPEQAMPDTTQASHYGDRGIALSVNKKLVRLMNGEVGVRHFAETGTTYYFSAPFDAPSSPTPHRRAADEKPRSLRVLVVEDTPINQLVANDILVKMGHDVEVAESGSDALEIMRAFDFDVVLMDCEMPVIDGYETTRLIRNRGTGVRNPDIPVIALTANALIGDRQKCIDAGMDDYITKPINSEQIKKILAKWSQPSSQAPDDDAAKKESETFQK